MPSVMRMQCINYHCFMESAQDTSWYIINTGNKVLCLNMSVKAWLAYFEQLAEEEHPLGWGSRDRTVKSRNRILIPSELGDRTI